MTDATPAPEPAAPADFAAPEPSPAAPFYPQASQATTVLILGVLSLVFCPVTGPVAWWMGKKEVDAIDAGLRAPENRSNAIAGKVLGIVGTVMMAVAVLVLLVIGAAIIGLITLEAAR